MGNEVLYREEMSEEELIACIHRVRSALPDIPVSTWTRTTNFRIGRSWSEAYERVIFWSTYPYWKAAHGLLAALHEEMYYQVKQAQPDKKIIITETRLAQRGRGVGCGRTRPRKRAEVLHQRAEMDAAEGIEMFYFSAFDEAWKVGAEGRVGGFLGALGQRRGAEVLRAGRAVFELGYL